MKKLGISLVALMIGLPMAARADISAITLKGNPAGTVAANTNVATTSYVQGAYNDLAGHINTNIAAINTLNGDASTAGSVAKAVADGVAGKQDEITAQNKLSADLIEDGTTNKVVTATDKAAWDAKQAQLTNGTGNVSATVKTAVGDATGQNAATNDSLVTEKAVRDAIDAAAYDDTALAADVAANTSAISTLNGGVNDSGSVANTVNTAITNLDLGNTYQAKTDSEVTTAEANAHNVLTAGTAVHTNLVNLATAVEGKQATIDSNNLLDADLVDDTNSTHKFVTASEKSQITTNANAIGNMNGLTGGETSLVEAVEAVRTSATAANGTKGFNVYGNWATPDSATGHVNVAAESGLQANN